MSENSERERDEKLEEIKRELKKLVRERRRNDLIWKITLPLSILLVLEIPLPPIPPSLAFPLAVISGLWTGFAFYRAKRMPVREAILISRLNKGFISAPILCSELDISLDTAEAILKEFVKRGIAEVDERYLEGQSELLYKIHGLLDDK